jgi:hypothetical protein
MEGSASTVVVALGVSAVMVFVPAGAGPVMDPTMWGDRSLEAPGSAARPLQIFFHSMEQCDDALFCAVCSISAHVFCILQGEAGGTGDCRSVPGGCACDFNCISPTDLDRLLVARKYP